jgi:hypothetical protein
LGFLFLLVLVLASLGALYSRAAVSVRSKV